ncbi:hypothetical protein [Methylorubrum populi]
MLVVTASSRILRQPRIVSILQRKRTAYADISPIYAAIFQFMKILDQAYPVNAGPLNQRPKLPPMGCSGLV